MAFSNKHKRWSGLRSAPTGDPCPTCPYCKQLMAPWPADTPGKACEECDQPIVLVPRVRLPDPYHFRPPMYDLWPLCSIVYIALLPIIGGTLVAMVLNLGSTWALVATLTFSCMAFGAAMVWEGTANMRSRTYRFYKKVHRGKSAWWYGLAHTLIGLYALAASIINMLGTLPIAARWDQMAGG